MATAGAIKAGEAFIELTLKGARGFGDKLKAAVRSMSRLAATALKVAGALTVAFGGAVLGALAKSVKHFVAMGDALQKMSLRTGVSVEALSELRFAAEQSGTNVEQLAQAMFRARRRIANAATENRIKIRVGLFFIFSLLSICPFLTLRLKKMPLSDRSITYWNVKGRLRVPRHGLRVFNRMVSIFFTRNPQPATRNSQHHLSTQ